MAQLDEAAFSAFYESQARGLWAYVYRVTGNGSDADDIVQEAFLRLLRAGPDSTDAEQRRRYLYRVASNLVVDRWRREKRAERIDAGRVVEPAHGGVSDGRSEEVGRLFAQLSARDRALLWLAYVEGESHQEIAASLGVGARSVKVLVFRAKRRLRELLRARGLSRT